MTKANSNGIYFHTKYEPAGWPAVGCEVQVNNTYKDKRKTGGLYRVQDNLQAPVKDNTWFTMHIIVRGPHVMTKVNNRTIVEWTQPEGWRGIRGAAPGLVTSAANCEWALVPLPFKRTTSTAWCTTRSSG